MNLNQKSKNSIFLWRILTNRIGLFLLSINLCLIAYGCSQIPIAPQESGGDCFTVSEALFLPMQAFASLFPEQLIIFAWLNFPAVFVSSLFTGLLGIIFPNWCIHTFTQIFRCFSVIFSSMQWLLIGHVIEKLLKNHLWKYRPK